MKNNNLSSQNLTKNDLHSTIDSTETYHLIAKGFIKLYFKKSVNFYEYLDHFLKVPIIKIKLKTKIDQITQCSNS